LAYDNRAVEIESGSNLLKLTKSILSWDTMEGIGFVGFEGSIQS
jgi:hypothetical protein